VLLRIEMSLTNRDASQITRNRQSRALYGYYNTVTNNSQVQQSGNVRPEQPGTEMNSILISRQLGACACSDDPTKTYTNNPTNCSAANNGGS
jgi:hypothetical protein